MVSSSGKYILCVLIFGAIWFLCVASLHSAHASDSEAVLACLLPDKACTNRGTATTSFGGAGYEMCVDVGLNGPCPTSESAPNDNDDWECWTEIGNDECTYVYNPQNRSWTGDPANPANCPSSAPQVCEDSRGRTQDDVLDDIQHTIDPSRNASNAKAEFDRKIDEHMNEACDCGTVQGVQTCKAKKTSGRYVGRPTQVGTEPGLGTSCIVQLCQVIRYSCTGYCAGGTACDFEYQNIAAFFEKS